MRRTATHTHRFWRGIPSWQRSVLAMVAVLVALVQLGGSSAAVADPPDVVGEWSAPFSWPIVAVHMSPSTARGTSSCSTGSAPR